MKIKNIVKFRDEMFAAIKDAAYWDATETYCTVKTKYLDADAHYKDMKRDEADDTLKPDCDWNFIPRCARYGETDAEFGAVALPHPLHFRGTDIYLVIDSDANAILYKDVGTHFEYSRNVVLEYYRSKMARAMVLIRAIDEVVKENRR